MVALGTTSETLVDETALVVARYVTSFGPDDEVVIESRVVARERTGVVTVPGLRAAASSAPLPRVDSPRPACSDPHEATIRALVPELPPCGPLVQDAYVAAGTRAGELVVVAWIDARESVVDLPATRGRVVVLGDELHPRFPGIVVPASEADRSAILAGAVLAAHESPELALDAAGAARGLAALERQRLGDVVLGVERGASEITLRAIGWSGEQDLRHSWRRVTSYEASLDDGGRLHMRSSEVMRSLDGREIPREDRRPSRGDDPLAGLEGL